MFKNLRHLWGRAPFKSNYNAVIIGGGITHPSGFVADVRYSIGLRGVHEESDAVEVKNAVFAITAGYMF